MKRTILVLFAVVCAWGQALPPEDKPGALNPDVTQANIQQTVCVANWTAGVRPPARFTDLIKGAAMTELGLPGAPSNYEADHRVPLGSGGAPRDTRNIWAQLWPEARLKDRLETYEQRAVCAGKISLADSQQIFLGNWWLEYDKLAPVEKWPPRKAAPAPKGKGN
jgi:hypothetical protein